MRKVLPGSARMTAGAQWVDGGPGRVGRIALDRVRLPLVKDIL
jgi:hypothetical protein